MSLFEDPMPTLFAGGLIAAILLGVVFTTGRALFLFLAIGVGCLTGLGLLVEQMVVTEMEEVEAVLYEARDHLEANDVDALVALLTPNAEDERQMIQNRLGSMRVDQADVAGELKIVVNELTSPPSARAKFLGRIAGSDKTGQMALGNYITKIEVEFKLANEGWRIDNVEFKPLQ